MSGSRLSKAAAAGVGAAAAIGAPIALAQPAAASSAEPSTQPWTIVDSNGIAHDCVVQLRTNYPDANTFETEVNSLGDSTCRQAAIAHSEAIYMDSNGAIVDTGDQTDGFYTVQRAYTGSSHLLTWSAWVDFKAPCQTNCASPLYQGPK